ncbi:MAG: dUTP diphosphatase [Bacillota bacterium]
MSANVKVLVKKMSHARDLPLPNYMSEQAAGMDLCAAVVEDVLLQPGEYKLVPTGIALAIPSGYEGQVRPRSGLALRHGITLLNTPGTIDADYRGEIKVILVNFGNKACLLKRGERVAQLVIQAVSKAALEEVDKLPVTFRGEGGFGHTDLL